MSKVRWGVLGCATFARKRAIPALLQTPSVELVGVASRDHAKAELFRSDFNLPRAYAPYEQMLEDPAIEAVYIPLPNGMHSEWMIKAALHGKHSLSEKPFASNAAEAREVARAAVENRVRVMEGFMWRFHSQHVRALEAVEAGAIGTVRLIRASFTFPIPRKPNVRFDRALAGGSIMDVGCYPISAARYYFRDEPVSACAGARFDPQYDVDMRAEGILYFRDGCAILDCGFDLPFRVDLEVVGDAGVIRIPKPWQPDSEAEIVVNGTPERFSQQNQYVSQFEHLSRCILNNTVPAYGPDDAVRQMAAIDMVYESIRAQRGRA